MTTEWILRYVVDKICKHRFLFGKKYYNTVKNNSLLQIYSLNEFILVKKQMKYQLKNKDNKSSK